MSDRKLAGCRILVVEDEYMMAEDLREELEEAGAIVLGPTPDIDDALSLLASERRIDGAVLDVNLGGKLSYPLADELLRRGVPLLLTTGYDLHTVPEKYHHLPRCDKPVRAAAVSEAISRLIHK